MRSKVFLRLSFVFSLLAATTSCLQRQNVNLRSTGGVASASGAELALAEGDDTDGIGIYFNDKKEVTDTYIKNAITPSSVWNGSVYGLVYNDDAEDNGRVMFQLVNADGTAKTSSIQLNPAKTAATDPQIVWNGKEFAVAYRQLHYYSWAIYLQRINANGSLNGKPLQVNAGKFRLDTAEAPRLFAMGDNYAVIYAETTLIIRQNLTFAVVTTSKFRVESRANIIEQRMLLKIDFDVAFNGNTFGLVYRETSSPLKFLKAKAIFQVVDKKGKIVGTRASLTGARFFELSATPSIVWNGTDYAMVYGEGYLTKKKLFFARASEKGELIGASKEIGQETSGALLTTSKLVWNKSEYAVAYRSVVGIKNSVFLSRLNNTGESLAADLNLGEATLEEASLNLLASDKGYVLSWIYKAGAESLVRTSWIDMTGKVEDIKDASVKTGAAKALYPLMVANTLPASFEGGLSFMLFYTDLSSLGRGVFSRPFEIGPKGITPEGIEIIDLGEGVNPVAINNVGQVVGQNAQKHAFIWSKADGMRDLGTLGGAESFANDVNDSGVVVGWSIDLKGKKKSFKWTKEIGWVNLDAETSLEGAAEAVNNLGTIVGWRTNGTVTKSARWTEGNPQWLTIFDSETVNHKSLGINEQGVIVGITLNSSGDLVDSFYYDGTLGTSNFTNIMAPDFNPQAGVNNSQLTAGASVGQADYLTIGPNQLTAIDKLLPTDPTSAAYGLNDNGLIVGASGDKGFMFDSVNKKVLDINTLPKATSSFDSISSLTGINDENALIGTGKSGDKTHGIMVLLGDSDPF
jgi:probable HAF family extracellular repeat protein